MDVAVEASHFVVSRRMTLAEATGYWIAQFLGGIIGARALALWAVLHGSRAYSVGLGVDGWGAHSMIGLGLGSAFAAEVIET